LREIRQNMSTQELDSLSACLVMNPDQECMRALPRLTGMPCLGNNDVRLLVNGEATFQAIFAAIDAATQVVVVQFFIVHDDELGLELQRRLCERAKAGSGSISFTTASAVTR
jgi:cardiolipin synthase